MRSRRSYRRLIYINIFVIVALALPSILTSFDYAGHVTAFPLASSAAAQSTSSSLFPLPKSPGTPTSLYEVNVGGTKSPLSYTIAALQGIVARTQPRIFLVSQTDDESWLSYLESNYGVSVQQSTATAMIQQFASYVENSNDQVKIIEFNANDPLFPLQVNLAKTLAGVYTALPVSSSDLPTIQKMFGSNIDILYNLNGMFTNDLTAYTWLWNLVGSSVTKSFLSLEPAGRVSLTDYEVEWKAFVFSFSETTAPTSQEASFAASVLSNYPQNTPVLGSFGLGGEENTVGFLSEHGALMILSDTATDLSVYSGFPTATNLQQSSTTSITYDKSKTYVMFLQTQGDGINYDMYYNWDHWTAIDPTTNQPYRDEVASSWQINPILAEVAPPIITRWYQTEGALQSFVSSPSGGGGYVYPNDLPDEAAWLSTAKGLDQNANLEVQFEIDATTTSELQTYISGTSPQAVLLWQNNGHAPETVSGIPVFYSSFWADPKAATFTSADVSSQVSEIKSFTAQGVHLVYVIMRANNPGLSEVQAIMNQLGSNYVDVNAAQFVSLYQQGA